LVLSSQVAPSTSGNKVSVKLVEACHWSRLLIK
jgi:hypothetical protein